jgi:hypothetical protein
MAKINLYKTIWYVYRLQRNREIHMLTLPMAIVIMALAMMLYPQTRKLAVGLIGIMVSLPLMAFSLYVLWGLATLDLSFH